MSTTIRSRVLAAALGAVVVLPIIVQAAAPATAATTASTNRLLQSMAVEEKLAHDVYVTLSQGGTSIRQMSNISRSETRHQSLLRDLMAARGVSDPTAGDAVGHFDDPATQALYDRLVSQGRQFAAAAAQVGITIEKLDIADLKQGLETKPPTDVTAVLNTLLQGSYRHLAAFTSAA